MGNEKDAQIQLIEQTIVQLNEEAKNIDVSLETCGTKVNQIATTKDSDWIETFAGDFNKVAGKVEDAAGEVRATANTLKKIIQEMLREDTAK